MVLLHSGCTPVGELEEARHVVADGEEEEDDDGELGAPDGAEVARPQRPAHHQVPLEGHAQRHVRRTGLLAFEEGITLKDMFLLQFIYIYRMGDQTGLGPELG